VTDDGQGHGPDIGSDEWKSVIEFRLGIRGKPDLPARASEAWCHANETYWEHQGRASITWGYGAPEINCQKVP
jgi:hypothetical protein